jgi:MHS family shikimate/dehydroshikimate transporter-like MFS transporter
MSWGWRLPFLGSALLVAVGTFIRLNIEETPDFTLAVREGKIVRFPVIDTILRYPRELLIGLGARITEISWMNVITIFGLNYAVTNMSLPRQLVLGAIALGAALELITIPLFGALSDRIGRRPVYMLGCMAAIALAFPVFWAIQTRDPVTATLGFVIGMSMGHGIMYGAQASFLGEMFPSNLRYSGASLGYQLAAPIGGGLIPIIAATIVSRNNGATWPVSVLMIAIALLTVLAVIFAKETAPALANSSRRAERVERSAG